MKFYLTDIAEEKEIEVKRWNGSSYGPDFFDNLETEFPAKHKKAYWEEVCTCTSEEYENLKAWWVEEIAAMNNGTCAHDMDYSECPDDDIAIFAD